MLICFPLPLICRIFSFNSVSHSHSLPPHITAQLFFFSNTPLHSTAFAMYSADIKVVLIRSPVSSISPPRPPPTLLPPLSPTHEAAAAFLPLYYCVLLSRYYRLTWKNDSSERNLQKMKSESRFVIVQLRSLFKGNKATTGRQTQTNLRA